MPYQCGKTPNGTGQSLPSHRFRTQSNRNFGDLRTLELGYRLDQIYEVWHFPKIIHHLFASYINTFLKIKEAFGCPDDCQTPNNSNSTSKTLPNGKAFRIPFVETLPNSFLIA
jgi:hypothetical protein